MWFVGDDWAEDHHDVEVQDASGRRLARARLAEGVEGIGRLHELIAGVLGDEGDPGQVSVGIETDRGPWVTALVAAGYRGFAINPRQVARYRERHGTSGAKSDAGDAHTLADLVRTDGHQLRPVAGDSPLAEGIKVVTRAHQNLIWDRHRQMLRLRASLREFFPAALEAFADLTAADALELLAAAPDPDRAARLSRSKIAAALKRARRRDVEGKAEAIQAVLRSAQLRQPAELTGAYAVTVRSQVAVIAALNAQIAALGEQVGAHFGRHPDAEIYRSQPGLGDLLGARVLGEFGDDPDRYDGARARKNYAGSAPITRASGKKRVVLARHVRNRRLADALHQQAFCALSASSGARIYYDSLRARGAGHHAALRQLSNRLVGILHGCLKTGRLYDETTAWAHHNQDQYAAA
jgi:transposase/transposase IS116/IS110/IS902 family protein